jgi:tRNA threonylcarbamoyl adenosine modification protein YeaZ
MERHHTPDVMTITLIISIAEGRIQFALTENGRILCAQDWAAASQGTELFAPALSDALRLLKLNPGQISRIACVRGPGSFTGLRLALGTTAALRRATGAMCAGLNYLEALARSLVCPPGKHARVITYARQNLVHMQDFIDAGQDTCAPLGEAVCCEPDQACRADGSPGPDIMIGSGVSRDPDFFADRMPFAAIVPHEYDLPSWRGLIMTAKHASWGHEDIEPLYLRPTEAEENLAEISKKRGDDPECAAKLLRELLNKNA